MDNVIKQIVKFKDKGTCSIGGGEKVFVLDWEGVNDYMVRVGSGQAERNCINPSFGHLPTEAELEGFTVEAKSWSIPDGGVFVLFGKQCTAAVQLLHTRKGADGYTVEFEYRIY